MSEYLYPYAAFVNLVSTTPRYLWAQDRLKKSYDRYASGVAALHLFQGESSVGAKPHKESNYNFKVHALQKLIDYGYSQIVWLDASVVFVNSPAYVIQRIQDTGFFMEDSAWSVGHWCNDRTLHYFGITREQAYDMPMFSTGITGIDMNNSMGQEFFYRWKQSMLDGYFHGSWDNHRHDMTCASIIANLMGLQHDYTKAYTYFPYVGGTYGPPPDTAIGHLEGI